MTVAGAAAGAGAQGSLDTLVAAEARRRRERPPGRDTEREALRCALRRGERKRARRATLRGGYSRVSRCGRCSLLSCVDDAHTVYESRAAQFDVRETLGVERVCVLCDWNGNLSEFCLQTSQD